MDFQEDKNNKVHLENFSCVKTIILTLTLISLKLLHVPQSNQDAGQAATADFPRNIPKQQSCLYTDESIQYHHAVSSVGITFLSLEYKHTTTTSLSKHLLLNFRSRSNQIQLYLDYNVTAKQDAYSTVCQNRIQKGQQLAHLK